MNPLNPLKKSRNKKLLTLNAETAKPGTLAGTPVSVLLSSAPAARPAGGAPIQVAGSSRSNRTSASSSLESPSPSPLLPLSAGQASHSGSSSAASSRSRRSSYHNKLSEQLATLELGVEFKLDLRSEDLTVLNELGCGNGGTVSRCLHVPTKAIMAKKVRLVSHTSWKRRTLTPPRAQVVHIATSESTRKQILRELQIMHDCSSPYIVSFYGAYLSDPHICICMEFMDKGCAARARAPALRGLRATDADLLFPARSLDNVYKKIGPIPEPILGKIAFAVVTGLTYLYEVHKIMHRGSRRSGSAKPRTWR